MSGQLMSDAQLAVMIVDMVQDWLRNKSDGWWRLDGLCEAQGITVADGRERAEFEARIYAQLDRWRAQAQEDDEEARQRRWDASEAQALREAGAEDGEEDDTDGD